MPTVIYITFHFPQSAIAKIVQGTQIPRFLGTYVEYAPVAGWTVVTAVTDECEVRQ